MLESQSQVLIINIQQVPVFKIIYNYHLSWSNLCFIDYLQRRRRRANILSLMGYSLVKYYYYYTFFTPVLVVIGCVF